MNFYKKINNLANTKKIGQVLVFLLTACQIFSCIVPESYLQLKMLIYNNYGSINLQKKLWCKFYINAPKKQTNIRLQACSNYQVRQRSATCSNEENLKRASLFQLKNMVFRDRQFIGGPRYCAASLLKSADNLKDKPSIRHKLPTVLTELEEQIICEFSRTTQLTFWRVFYCFKH